MYTYARTPLQNVDFVRSYCLFWIRQISRYGSHVIYLAITDTVLKGFNLDHKSKQGLFDVEDLPSQSYATMLAVSSAIVAGQSCGA